MSESRRALDRLLAGPLDDEVRADIERRMAAGDDPAAILEDVDAVDLLAATAGDAALDDAEADALFDAILADLDGAARPVPQPQPANNNRGWLVGLALAAVALLAVVPAVMSDDAYTGIKGGSETLAAPQLRAFVGDGKGGVVRELRSGEAVPSGTPVVFRYRTTQEASAWLLADEGGVASNPWHSPTQPAGEYEVQTHGRALAWMVDTKLTVGLLLVAPGETPTAPALSTSCGGDAPCTRFEVRLAR